ncbi:hypothetical protein ABT024_22365 [Streptomyces sp. NPDC002812]|uniref:hypothetical protein n=1 Tax=Streptomyces sp. NPDC002812 TaxID=3154434 RepID=UPI003324A6BB
MDAEKRGEDGRGNVLGEMDESGCAGGTVGDVVVGEPPSESRASDVPSGPGGGEQPAARVGRRPARRRLAAGELGGEQGQRLGQPDRDAVQKEHGLAVPNADGVVGQGGDPGEFLAEEVEDGASGADVKR